MTSANQALNESLARSSRPFQTIDSTYKAQGLELKAQFEQGKISRRDYLARLAVLVAEYKNEKGQ